MSATPGSAAGTRSRPTRRRAACASCRCRTPARPRSRSRARVPGRSSRASCRSRQRASPDPAPSPSARSAADGAATLSWRSKSRTPTSASARDEHDEEPPGEVSPLHRSSTISRASRGQQARGGPKPAARPSLPIPAYGSSGMRSTGSRSPLATTGKAWSTFPARSYERPARCDRHRLAVLRQVHVAVDLHRRHVRALPRRSGRSRRWPRRAGRRYAPSSRTARCASPAVLVRHLDRSCRPSVKTCSDVSGGSGAGRSTVTRPRFRRCWLPASSEPAPTPTTDAGRGDAAATEPATRAAIS